MKLAVFATSVNAGGSTDRKHKHRYAIQATNISCLSGTSYISSLDKIQVIGRVIGLEKKRTDKYRLIAGYTEFSKKCDIYYMLMLCCSHLQHMPIVQRHMYKSTAQAALLVGGRIPFLQIHPGK